MKLTKQIKTSGLRLWSGLLDLVYPRFCISCDRSLSGDSNTFICLGCSDELPFTNYHEIEENPVTDKFAGRLPLFFGGAFLVYKNDSITQKMIAKFKYANRPDIAQDLGSLYGQQLQNNEALRDLDFIIPVPLHSKRQYERGYNQAEMIAKGMANYLNAPCLTSGLVRNTFEASQTKKSMEERFKNVANVFSAGKTDLNHKKVLLVDDVLTTGATLESCAEALLASYPEVKIGIAAIGMRA